MSMVLQCKDGGNFKPHPEGIHPAVCVDVVDLGLEKSEYQGQEKMVNKLRLVFESEQKSEDGRNCTISKNFTASLHPKAKLWEFLGKWRGRPLMLGESVDLAKLIGACCTLVISHQQNMSGKTYASIDAVSKPTKKLAPSGAYDPAATRQRVAEWKAKQNGGQRSEVGGQRADTGGNIQHSTPNAQPVNGNGNKSGAPATAPAAEDNVPFDPEVGF